MNANTNKNENIKPPAFPSLSPCPLEEIHAGLAAIHGLDNYVSQVDKNKTSIGKILLMCMTDVVIFHPLMLYDVLNCKAPYRLLSTYLPDLKKRGLIKTAVIPSSTDFSSVYYLSKAGYEKAAAMIGNCKPYKGKTGQRLMETANHDFGVSCGYLSFVRSPFILYPTYDVSNMFEKSTMPSGKFMRHSLRPDAVFELRSEHTFGKVYLEHDTGSEATVRMIDKLNLYLNHAILNASLNGKSEEQNIYEQNCILFTFRKDDMNKPDCFSYRKVGRMLAAMSDSQSVEDMDKEEFAPILSELKRWTPAFKKHWKKAELNQYVSDVKDRIDESLIRYRKYYQRNAAAARRNSALRILMEEYKKGRESKFQYSIRAMLSGYPVLFCSYNNVDNLLPFLYMEDYPQAIEWLKSVLHPYYGEITYRGRHITFPGNIVGGETITMSNVFDTATDEVICVEYISCDLSALMRMCILCHTKGYDLGNMPFKCVFVVDSYKDANVLISMMDKKFRIGETVLRHNKFYDISYLSVGGNYLFSIDKNGNEVKIQTKEKR